jgi:thioredoxin 1
MSIGDDDRIQCRRCNAFIHNFACGCKQPEKGDGTNHGSARPAGAPGRADEKDAAVDRHACSHRTRKAGNRRAGATSTRDDRSNSKTSLLGAARRFRRDFDYSNLELFFVMDNSETINLDESNFDREVTHSDKPVLVDFWAEWCGPCKLIAPLLDEVAREKAGSVKVAKVNVDENQSLSFKYNIRAIPALLFFKNGQLRDQVTGMTSKKDLLNRIDALA